VTLNELSQYYKLTQYIKTLEVEITELETRAYGVGASSSDGAGGHSGGISDKTGLYAVRLVDKLDRLCKTRFECEQQRDAIYAYINITVAQDDKLIAAIMYWRFIQQKTWNEVAWRVGGNNNSDSVKKICLRYIRKKNLSQMSR